MQGLTWKGTHRPLLLHSSGGKVGAALRKKTPLPHLGIRAAAPCLEISLLPVAPLPGSQGRASASIRAARSQSDWSLGFGDFLVKKAHFLNLLASMPFGQNLDLRVF